MSSKEFIQDALRTESRPEKLALSKGGTLALMSLLVSAAAVADTCKRAIFYGKPLNRVQLGNDITTLQSSLMTFQTRLPSLDQPEDTVIDLWEPNLRLLHAAIGMFGESGELMEALVRQMITGNLDMVNVAEELGDVDWYKAIAHDETGVSEEDTRAKVIAKLRARYPDKFDTEKAYERDLAAERAVLEESDAGAVPPEQPAVDQVLAEAVPEVVSQDTSASTEAAAADLATQE